MRSQTASSVLQRRTSRRRLAMSPFPSNAILLRVLWARSSSPYLSRLQTTMNVENFWKQLKHDFLHHLVRPRIDQLVWIVATKVRPAWIARAEALEDNYRAGRSRKLTTFQQYFKNTWKKHSQATLSGRPYSTDVSRWQCNCGHQKFDAYALCKHLVQAVPSPPPQFFTQIYRGYTIPIYRHTSLHSPEDISTTLSEDEGGITDRDDHFLNNSDALTSGKW